LEHSVPNNAVHFCHVYVLFYVACMTVQLPFPKAKCFLSSYPNFLVRREAIACVADLSFSPDVLFIYFFSTRDLREILHDGQY